LVGVRENPDIDPRIILSKDMVLGRIVDFAIFQIVVPIIISYIIIFWRVKMKNWIDPEYCDVRLGFEVTAYVHTR